MSNSLNVVTEPDPRTRIFCSNRGPKVFGSVAYPNEVWTPDPLDVESVHAEAREVFARLIDQVTAPGHSSAGKTLLLRGESGSGKTHLMRAFRSESHRLGQAYFIYMQMTTETDYARYLLNKFVESMEQVYYLPHSEDTGLMRLSQAVAELAVITPAQRERLRDELDDETRRELVETLADAVIDNHPDWNLELDLVRAMLLLQCPQPSIYRRVIKWLRAEDLSPSDREKLGDLSPNLGQCRWRLEGLGRLMAHVHRAAGQGVALVICADQFEDFFRNDDQHARQRFNQAIHELNSLAEHLPNSIMLISCLEGYYDGLRESLNHSMLDRLEHDPAPVVLQAERTPAEQTLIVARHLEHLYDQAEVEFAEAEPTFPISPQLLGKHKFPRTRDLLKWCHDYRQSCIQAEALLAVVEVSPGKSDPVDPDRDELIRLERAWNDLLTSVTNPPEDEEQQALLLGESIRFCNQEISTRHEFQVEVGDRFVAIAREASDKVEEWMLAGVCNRAPQGGWLASQISEVEEKIQDRPHPVTPIILRSKSFPAGAKTQVGKQLGKLVAGGGRRVQVSDSDWRAMLAMKSFRQQHDGNKLFPRWLETARPLSHLKSIRETLGLATLKPVVAAADKPPANADAQASLKPASAQDSSPHTKDEPKPIPPVELKPQPTERLSVGRWRGMRADEVALEPSQLKMHAAFIGGTGSGKTTAALNLLEQLLLRGVPAILLDRKGDLCRYADDSAYANQGNELDQRRQALRSRVDVAVYTPGAPAGRPLALSIIPADIAEASSSERQLIAAQAAQGLGAMLGLKPSSATDQECQAILQLALELLAEQIGPPTLEQLLSFIGSQDPLLINRMGYLNQKRLGRLTSGLQTLILNPRRSSLFQGEETLDVDRLLGLGNFAVPGKTRLSVISSKFLGETVDMQFWVARLLLELRRWMSRNPSDGLQAVILVDEADIYLPAVGKPVSKEPMEDLLKRSRSAGLSVFLASQNPGDFDYRCRENLATWFIGRVKEGNSLKKLKEMLADCKQNVSEKLASQSVGEFYLVQSQEVAAIKSHRSAVETSQLSEAEILSLARIAAPR